MGLIAGLVVLILLAVGTVFYFTHRRPAGPQPIQGNFVRPPRPPGINSPG